MNTETIQAFIQAGAVGILAMVVYFTYRLMLDALARNSHNIERDHARISALMSEIARLSAKIARLEAELDDCQRKPISQPEPRRTASHFSALREQNPSD